MSFKVLEKRGAGCKMFAVAGVWVANERFCLWAQARRARRDQNLTSETGTD